MDDAKLVSMKLTKKETKEELSYPSMKQPEYPWGLSITLESEQLKALGITTLPAIGQTISITAKAQVSSVSQYESQGDEQRRSVSLQITDLAIG